MHLPLVKPLKTVFQFVQLVLGVLGMELQLLRAHQVSFVQTERVTNTNILVQLALFHPAAHRTKLVVQVVQVEIIVEKVRHQVQTLPSVLVMVIFALLEQLRDPHALLDRQQQMEVHV